MLEAGLDEIMMKIQLSEISDSCNKQKLFQEEASKIAIRAIFSKAGKD